MFATRSHAASGAAVQAHKIIGFGVLTTNDVQQAMERAGAQGRQQGLRGAVDSRRDDQRAAPVNVASIRSLPFILQSHHCRRIKTVLPGHSVRAPAQGRELALKRCIRSRSPSDSSVAAVDLFLHHFEGNAAAKNLPAAWFPAW